MALYVSGLMMLTGAIELLLAFVIRTHISMPDESSIFWPIYFGAVGLLTLAGGTLVARGLRELRAEPRPAGSAGAD